MRKLKKFFINNKNIGANENENLFIQKKIFYSKNLFEKKNKIKI